MPITRIEVNEYHCSRCGYKWINRYNGKDGPLPKNCAKCKKTSWNSEVKTSKEVGLRRRIEGYNRLYSSRCDSSKVINLIKWNPNVVKEFLSMEPRATIEELKKVVYSSPLRRFNNGSHIQSMKNYALDQDRPGYLKYDTSRWMPDPNNPNEKIYNRDPDFITDHDKAVIREAQIRRGIMEDILKKRGIVEITDAFVEESESNETFDELVAKLKGNTKYG
jgi:hypothetical protein